MGNFHKYDMWDLFFLTCQIMTALIGILYSIDKLITATLDCNINIIFSLSLYLER